MNALEICLQKLSPRLLRGIRFSLIPLTLILALVIGAAIPYVAYAQGPVLTEEPLFLSQEVTQIIDPTSIKVNGWGYPLDRDGNRLWLAIYMPAYYTDQAGIWYVVKESGISRHFYEDEGLLTLRLVTYGYDTRYPPMIVLPGTTPEQAAKQYQSAILFAEWKKKLGENPIRPK